MSNNPEQSLSAPLHPQYYELSLKDMLLPDPSQGLFTNRKSQRKVGCITNIRKNTVSNLLNTFEPFHEGQKREFNIKKQIVMNAIEAIYTPFSAFSLNVPQSSKKAGPRQSHTAQIFSTTNQQHSFNYDSPYSKKAVAMDHQQPHIPHSLIHKSAPKALNRNEQNQQQKKRISKREVIEERENEKIKRSFSFRKINYCKGEGRYSEDEIRKLKIRSGLVKVDRK